MKTGYIPPRPAGFTEEALFAQAVWDRLWGQATEMNSSSTVKVSKGTKGIKLRAKGGSGGKETCPYG